MPNDQALNKARQDIDSTMATIAAIWVAVVGVIAYMFLPLLVGGLADDLGFSNQQLGYIGAAEAGGMGLANALAVFWIRRWNWRTVILVSVITMVVANLASTAISSFSSMFVARLVDGFAGGSLIALGVACQSDNSNADRVFGYFIATEMVFSSLGFLVLPSITEKYSVDGIFVTLALISLSGLLVIFYHPREGLQSRSDVDASGNARVLSKVAIAALIGALFFFMSQGGLWTFVERIGVASALDSGSIGKALAASSLFGLIGALGANWLAQRTGRLNALIVVLVGELICISLLYGELNTWRYFVSTGLFILFWSMGLPLMLSQCNRLDASGRLVILLYAVGKLGYTLGPAMMGLLIFGTDFSYVLLSTVLLCSVGLGISIWLSRDKYAN